MVSTVECQVCYRTLTVKAYKKHCSSILHIKARERLRLMVSRDDLVNSINESLSHPRSKCADRLIEHAERMVEEYNEMINN